MLDKKTLDLFNRYTEWLKKNMLEDTIYNYMFYVEHIEKTTYIYDLS